MVYFIFFLFSVANCANYYIGQNQETLERVEQFKTRMHQNEIRCFISRAYSGEDAFILDEQNNIDSCLRYVGIKTVLDVNAEKGGLSVGEDIMRFMEDNIKNCQFVISFFTPAFLERSKIPGSGVARELAFISDRIKLEHDNHFFIPILAKGEMHESVHADFRSYLYINPIKNGKFDTDLCITELLKVLENRIFPNKQLLDTPSIEQEKKAIPQTTTWRNLVQMVKKGSSEKSPADLQHILTFLKSWPLLVLEEKEKFLDNFADSISFDIKEWTLHKSFNIEYNFEEEILTTFKTFSDLKLIADEQRKKASSSFKKDKIPNIKTKKIGNCDTPSGKYEIKLEMMVSKESSPGYCSSLFFCYTFIIKPKSFESPSINEIIEKSQ